MHIVWSPQSLRDLDSIHEYIAKDSERYADLTVERIFAAVEKLLRFPHPAESFPSGMKRTFEKLSLDVFASCIVRAAR